MVLKLVMKRTIPIIDLLIRLWHSESEVNVGGVEVWTMVQMIQVMV